MSFRYATKAFVPFCVMLLMAYGLNCFGLDALLIALVPWHTTVFAPSKKIHHLPGPKFKPYVPTVGPMAIVVGFLYIWDKDCSMKCSIAQLI